MTAFIEGTEPKLNDLKAPTLPADMDKRFDEEFVRDDGLIDKYSHYPDKELKSTPDAIKIFLAVQLENAKRGATKAERERCVEILEQTKTGKPYPNASNNWRKDLTPEEEEFNQALAEAVQKINGR